MVIRSIFITTLIAAWLGRCSSSAAVETTTTASPASSPCAFLSGAPVFDVEIPSLLHNLHFLGVDAKVYRQTPASGSKPRLRFVRYSSTPTVDVRDGRIVISAGDGRSSCDDDNNNNSNSGKDASSSSPSLFSSRGLFKTLTTSSIAAAGLIASNRSGSSSFLGLLLIALYSIPEIASASSSGCTPSMEVIVEAPPYYLGSVEECLRSVSNPDHCPEPFPQFPQCTSDGGVAPNSCKLAVVGAGTGGLYTAFRLVEEGVFDGSDVCVFEATDRVGGRLYSLRGFGPEGDISVDAGAYRTWPEYTPTTHALITEMLGFKVACYDEDDPCLKFNIVGDDGEKIGFATFVEELMSRLIDRGACYFPRHNLVSIKHNEDDGGSNTLTFANGVTTTASHSTILNIPQRALLEVVRESDLYSTSDPQKARTVVTEEKDAYDALHSVQTEIVTKLYLYYEDAWWHRLGLRSGDFSVPGDARNMLLQGRYHDGHVKCVADGDGGDEKCYGFLLAVYAHDFSGTKAQYFRRFQRDRPEPVTILSSTKPEEEEFLRHAHERIVGYHVYGENNEAVLNATSLSPFQLRKVIEASEPPTFAVLANWNTAAFGAGGGWHHWTDMSKSEKAMKPLNSLGLHVVNEAFSKIQGWAEGSLLLADEILEEYYGVARPWDFDVPDGIFYLAQTSSEECVAEEDTGGSGSSSGGGGGTGGGELDLCFAAGSMVELEDGSVIPIEDVRAGDYVATGVDGKAGLVTEKLVHRVVVDDDKDDESRRSEVVVVSTEQGDLVGTPDHPVLFRAPTTTDSGDAYAADATTDAADPTAQRMWIELGDALDRNLLKNARREFRTVDVFYNLEIDGHQPGKSSHSYVVNGIVASGLGDNPLLNELFPRQTVWKKGRSKQQHHQDEKDKSGGIIINSPAASIANQ